MSMSPEQPEDSGLGKVARDAERIGHEIEERAPSWLRPHNPENRLPVVAAILVAMALQLAISDAYGLRLGGFCLGSNSPSWRF